MRTLALLLLALLSGTGAGVAWRLLAVEWLKPDPILVVVVFIALAPKNTGGAAVLTVFFLALVADALGGCPTGCHFLVYLPCWLLLSRLSKVLSMDTWSARVLLLGALALLAQLLMFLPLFLMGAPAALLVLQAKLLVPVAMLTALWSLCWWPLCVKLEKAVERLRA